MRLLFVAKTVADWHNGVRMYWAADRLGYDVDIISLNDLRLKDKLITYQPDWAFVTGSRNELGLYQTCREYAKLCVWCADCVDEARLRQWQRLAGMLDCVFTPITALPEVLKERFITSNAVWMPQYWDQTFTTVQKPADLKELCHLRGPGDRRRAEWELRLARKYDARFVGGHFPPYIVRGHEAGNIYAGSKISITIARQNKWLGRGMEISDRIFNATGCGSFFLQYETPELDRIFEVGKHVATYDGTYESLVDTINFYLTNEDLRKKIAEAGQKHCLEHHTIDVRMKQMWEYLCALPS